MWEGKDVLGKRNGPKEADGGKGSFAMTSVWVSRPW